MDTAPLIGARDSDEAAFAQLTILAAGRLNRIAFSILRDRELAQDATQQALIDI